MGIFSLLKGTGMVEAVKDIADEFITTEEERLEYELKKKELELKEKEIEKELVNKIHETNIAEAQTGHWFIAGWRPFIGWTGGIALLYTYVVSPFLHSLFKAYGKDFPLPQVDEGLLAQLIIAMLGVLSTKNLNNETLRDIF